MVIAHIVNDDGGVGNVVVNLANHQINYNKVYIFTTNGKQKFLEKLDNRIIVVKLKKSKLPPMIVGSKINYIYRLLRKKHPNEMIVLHAHNIATIGFLANVSKLPIICTIHGLSTFPNSKRTIRTFLQEKAIKNIVQRISKYNGIVVGVSNHTSNYYGKMANIKIRTIYNGCQKTNHKIKNNDVFCFCHVGDISTNKGWDLELRAYKNIMLNNEGKKTKFVFAGRLCNYNEQDIEDILKSHNLSGNNAEYLGIIKDVQKDVLSNSDVLLLASKSEGLPMCIVEAFSMGVPVIATNVGGIPEIVRDNFNGYIVNRDESEIYQKMNKLLTDKELLEKMKKNAFNTYKERFTDSIMNQKYYEEYLKICKGAKYESKQ